MKKTYIIPETEVVYIMSHAPLLQASDPSVTIDPDDEAEAGNAQTKGNNHYNVWNDDWREKEE